MFPFKGMFQAAERLPRHNQMQPPHAPTLHHHHPPPPPPSHQQQLHHITDSQHNRMNPPPPPIVATAQWPLNKADYQDLANDQVDWAALAQQWIHMKETCTTDDMLAAPPPPIISSSGGGGGADDEPSASSQGEASSSRLHEEKGEAPMEMDRDDDDNVNNQTITHHHHPHHHHNPFMVTPPNIGSVLPQLNQPPPNWINPHQAPAGALPPIWQQAPPPGGPNSAQWNKSI